MEPCIVRAASWALIHSSSQTILQVASIINYVLQWAFWDISTEVSQGHKDKAKVPPQLFLSSTGPRGGAHARLPAVPGRLQLWRFPSKCSELQSKLSFHKEHMSHVPSVSVGSRPIQCQVITFLLWLLQLASSFQCSTVSKSKEKPQERQETDNN